MEIIDAQLRASMKSEILTLKESLGDTSVKLDSVHDLQTKLVHFIHKANDIDANHLKLIDTLNSKVATIFTDIDGIKKKMDKENSANQATFKTDHSDIASL